MQLIPVIELLPSDYGRQTHPLPIGSSAELTKAYYYLWKASLADSGITELEPIIPGSYFVPVDRIIDPSTIEKILHVCLKSNDEYDLVGGYALVVDENITILPTCCCDLGNIDSWEMAAAWTSPQDEMVWIGHPWLLVHAIGDMLYFTETTEGDDQAQQPIFIISRFDLLRAIEVAHEQLNAFAERILPVMKAVFPGNLRIIINRLLYFDA